MPPIPVPGTSTYIGSRPGSPTPSTPASQASSAMSVYSMPSAAVMYGDFATANAINQRLIQEAINRARMEAERLRLLEEERQRRLAEQRALAAMKAKEKNAPIDASIPSPTPAQWNTATQMVNAQRVRYAAETAARQTIGWDNNVVPPVEPSGVSLAPWGYTKQAGTMGAEGWMQNAAATHLSVASPAAYDNWMEQRDKLVQESYKGTPNWKELAQRYEGGPNLEGYYARAFEANVDVWGEPVPIKELVPTGRYEYDPATKTRRMIYEEKIVGYNWDWRAENAPRDPYTGELLNPEQSYRPVSYLGVNPGTIILNTPARPAEDAPLEEWRNYYNGLKTSIVPPKYTPQAPLETLNRMNVEERKQFQKELIKAHLLPTDALVVPGQMSEELVSRMASLMAGANASGTTWEVHLDQWKQHAKQLEAASSGGGYGGGGGGGGTTKYTQIQYTQTSVAQARSLLVGVLTEALGRYPTDDEVEKFLTMLNKKEKKSPGKSVTVTTTTGDNTRAVTRTTPTTVDAQALAEEFARSLEGYDENATDRYMNALFKGLGETIV